MPPHPALVQPSVGNYIQNYTVQSNQKTIQYIFKGSISQGQIGRRGHIQLEEDILREYNKDTVYIPVGRIERANKGICHHPLWIKGNRERGMSLTPTDGWSGGRRAA